MLAVFYAIVGILELVALVQAGPALPAPHLGVLAVFSLIAAYGLLTTRKWSVWLVILLFFPQFVFGVVTLNAAVMLNSYTSGSDVTVLMLNAGLTVFVILSFVSFVYVAMKRNSFQRIS